MEDYKFFQFFCMNDRLYTTVFSFGNHICNQAARIRVAPPSHTIFPIEVITSQLGTELGAKYLLCLSPTLI
jgi:hypothetical protein